MTEPCSFEEAVEDPAWVDAMVEEYDSIVRNSAWEIFPRPERKSVMGSRWIYKVKQRNDGLFVSQGKYAREILVKFNTHGCKPVDTPLPRGWRKEDATLAELSQAMVKPTKLFWKAGKHVLRYLRGTSAYGLWYRQEDEVKLCGFIDANWTGIPTDRKSTSGGIFNIGLTIVSWYSRNQRSMALSSAEAEYMAASLAAFEAIWMRKILVGLFGSQLEPTVIYCDN
eukprot:PITA_13987